jgi:hypothetical protein
MFISFVPFFRYFLINITEIILSKLVKFPDQMRVIPLIQEWLQIQKLTNEIHSISGIISIDEKKKTIGHDWTHIHDKKNPTNTST